ncbi:comEA [Mytilus coruscus]|uniref:ComEA n=1 Tax=Mytilus coruscus TaxID=42192 RepID=A0A6J8E6A9_MYTCO|nr:comEA [Mytilus coruscus]
MPQPININTATDEELKSIKNIGPKRAGIITAAREERGQLTIEDLKLLEGIPNTIWDPLVDEGAIVSEPLEHTKKDIDPKQRVRELEEQMSGMNAIMKQRMQEKQVALQDMQHQMQIMQDEFKTRLTEQNAKFQKCIEQMEHDHKENTEALSVDFEKREHEMREEIRMRDNKMKQADEMRLTTERIEKLFPSGIYSKQEDRKPLKTTLKSGPGYTPKGNLQDRSEKRVEGPSAPKLATYDEKTDWRPYFLQFSHIANRYKWTPQNRLDKLIECLRDKALKFYSVKAKGVQEDYDKLCNKLNERFGRRDLPHIIRRQLQDLKQDQDETLEEYTERTQEMATDGYPDTPEEFVEIVAIDAFLKG